MNTILVPIDFSPAAINAATYAAQLASRLQAQLMLVHMYQTPVTMNDMPVMMLSAEELQQSADTQLERARTEMAAQFPDLPITTQSRLGDVNDELEDLCKEAQPVAIVLGSHGMSGLERMLFGSTTVSVMRHTWIPVIAVPTNYKYRDIRNIVLAADLQDSAKIPTQKIITLTQNLNAQLHLVHVSPHAEPENEKLQPLLQKLQPLHPQFHTVLHADVKDGLLQYLQQSGADMVLVLPHEHSLVERLFFKLHTDDIIKHAPIPVMAIKC